MKIFKEIFRFFENFIEIISKIYGKFEKILEIWICRGFRGGAPPPPKQAKALKKWSNNQWNHENLEDFHYFLANFDFKTRSLIKNQGKFDGIL